MFMYSDGSAVSRDVLVARHRADVARHYGDYDAYVSGEWAGDAEAAFRAWLDIEIEAGALMERAEVTMVTLTVERMKAQINADIRSGRVPVAVTSYSELHDYVDANFYGGIDSEHPVMNANVFNAASDIVNEWLVNGRTD